MVSRLTAIYHVRAEAATIAERACAIAVEQSVEMPVAAIDDRVVLDEIVGKVEATRALDKDLFEVRIGLAVATIGHDAGQLLNMLFGNTSLHDDVVLHDVDLPGEFVAVFGGPRHGLAALRLRVGAEKRALTCSALKPQGLSPVALAELARKFAAGGVDYIKDDHGLADQDYSPFAARIEAVATALAPYPGTRYVPSLSGDLGAMRRQVAAAAAAGIDAAMVAPMVCGVANFYRLAQDNPGFTFVAHPALAGAARIAPALLMGKLFRLLGADAVVFPNHGGRFGYSPATCRALARAALSEWHGLHATVPVAAGGMTLDRVPEMLDFYGADIMLLIGGALLQARERLTEETAAFVAAVQSFPYG
ncbi:MAG TPA: RuBisCO large subunit C-terminal-like domain-containing protein [Xanthobacteraceae bacterium]|nr:RuBisCO large subunit C-terminal-like domain-containing protein [Xanthobacteraceae bacterium]